MSYSGNVSIVFNIVLGLFTRITHNCWEGNQRKSFILSHYDSQEERPQKNTRYTFENPRGIYA
jgi:hypothetical protein